MAPRAAPYAMLRKLPIEAVEELLRQMRQWELEEPCLNNSAPPSLSFCLRNRPSRDFCALQGWFKLRWHAIREWQTTSQEKLPWDLRACWQSHPMSLNTLGAPPWDLPPFAAWLSFLHAVHACSSS